MKILIVVFGAILLSIGVFAAAHVYRYGWNAATYNGHDPWALFFFGIGGAFVPLIVATVIAGIWRTFSRSSSFISVWLMIFGIATVLFAVPTFYVGANLG